MRWLRRPTPWPAKPAPPEPKRNRLSVAGASRIVSQPDQPAPVAVTNRLATGPTRHRWPSRIVSVAPRLQAGDVERTPPGLVRRFGTQAAQISERARRFGTTAARSTVAANRAASPRRFGTSGSRQVLARPGSRRRRCRTRCVRSSHGTGVRDLDGATCSRGAVRCRRRYAGQLGVPAPAAGRRHRCVGVSRLRRIVQPHLPPGPRQGVLHQRLPPTCVPGASANERRCRRSHGHGPRPRPHT